MIRGCFYHTVFFPGCRCKGVLAMDQLTACKNCSKEVAQSATVCPHCGAKLKMNLIEKLILFVIVSFVALFLLGKVEMWVK